jgi:hypothetical protein
MHDLLRNALEGGGIVDIIFGFMAIECLVLLAFAWVTQGGLNAREILSLMLPGIFLLLALRSALEHPTTIVIAGWLLAALIAHLWDLKMRLRNRSTGSGLDVLSVSRN